MFTCQVPWKNLVCGCAVVTWLWERDGDTAPSTHWTTNLAQLEGSRFHERAVSKYKVVEIGIWH